MDGTYSRIHIIDDLYHTVKSILPFERKEQMCVIQVSLLDNILVLKLLCVEIKLTDILASADRTEK